MTRLGVDYSTGRPSITALKAAGYSFACRYLSNSTSGKNLSRAEATQLRAGGIDVVSNWEWSANAALRGRAQGVADATDAKAQHLACGGPPTRPIYFSVDFDASEAQQPAINAYFAGVASVIGLARTGAYGGYWVISRLFAGGLIRYGWQTYAWSGGNWDSRAQLRQVQNGITVGGADCDRDEAHADDFGQWGYQGDDMANLQDNDPNFLALIWREEAEISGRDVVAGGPRKGESVWTVAALKDIQSKLSALTTPTGGTATQDQVDAAMLKALQDPTVIAALGAAVASHIKVS